MTKITLFFIVITLVLSVLVLLLGNQKPRVDIPLSKLTNDVTTHQQSNIPSDWKRFVFEDSNFKIEFLHPNTIDFFENDIRVHSTGYSIGGNSIDSVDGINYHLSITRRDMEDRWDSFQYALPRTSMNTILPPAIETAKGMFVLTDGLGTEDYFFMTAYFMDDKYYYEFESSRPEVSEEAGNEFKSFLDSIYITRK